MPTAHSPTPSKTRVDIPRRPNEESSWTWPGAEGSTLTVKAYTWHTDVTLYLDGKVVGHKAGDDVAKLTASFDVPFGGTNLTAVATGGKAGGVAVATVLAAGAPAGSAHPHFPLAVSATERHGKPHGHPARL